MYVWIYICLYVQYVLKYLRTCIRILVRTYCRVTFSSRGLVSMLALEQAVTTTYGMPCVVFCTVW